MVVPPTVICFLPTRVVNSDFGMGGDLSPPIGGGLMGGDKVSMGGDSRMIFATILHAVLTTKKPFLPWDKMGTGVSENVCLCNQK